MKIIASLLVIVGLIAVVLYLKPISGASDVFNSALHESNSPQPDTSSFLSKLKEPTQPQHSTHPQSVSADTVPFYDTKSDLSIQPIDPEKDPANEIKAK
ncbi:hypothetical protein F935_03480 [Acinetobacter calcoaceticus ANC 3811]|uniref:Uncharacterized protein n=1 Tax=Acinetobacter calcoaceticus ANC 3811 TaxID=1217690 RepID=R8XW38_ACICA|nr:hypothetical protein [Acinetobacter calcoaceticus]EOQ61134.1 hypothetical protein F935_03480 [Acinetobacter calcoaceticus ANC 3811]